MKCTSFFVAVTAAAIALTGCDWGGTGSEESWNDAYAWANFSGTYKLVTNIQPIVEVPTTPTVEPTTSEPTTPSTPATPSTPTVITKTGSITHSLKRGETGYATGQKDLKPGTVTITSNVGHSWKDEGDGRLTDLNGTYHGSVSYASGMCAINWDSTVFPGNTITITFAYEGTEGGGSSGGSTPITPGGSGGGSTPVTPGGSSSGGSTVTKPTAPITWLTVTQKGNLLTMKDNDGTTYAGRITGASVPSTGSDGYTGSGHIRFPFEVTSTSNNRITISGSLSGDWTGGVRGTLDNRAIEATYHTGKSATQFQAVSGRVTLIAQSIIPADGTY